MKYWNFHVGHILYMWAYMRERDGSMSYPNEKAWKLWHPLFFVCWESWWAFSTLCGQIFNLSIQAIPAVGVACELFPASPHWSHAGRRGASLLCQQLMWCSAGRSVSSLSIPFPFFQTWNLEDRVWVKKGSYFTHILTTAWMTYMTYKHRLFTRVRNFFNSST